MLLYLSKLASSFDDGQKKIQAALEDGRAMDKFKEMIINQGVALDLAEKLCAKGDFPVSYYMELMKCNDTLVTEITSKDKGKIHVHGILRYEFYLKNCTESQDEKAEMWPKRTDER